MHEIEVTLTTRNCKYLKNITYISDKIMPTENNETLYNITLYSYKL